MVRPHARVCSHLRVAPWLLLALSVAITSNLFGGTAKAQVIQWYVEVLTDPITQDPILEARILTKKGYRFHFMKRADNSLWAEFRMPRHIEKGISRKKLPTYWIDGNDPVNLESLKELEVGFTPTLYQIDEKGVRFILWGALKRGKVPPPLRNFMLGETLHVRYWTALNEMEQTEIPLKRANEAIAQMLNIAPLSRAPDIAKRQRTETFDTLARDYLEFCEELRFVGDDNDFGTCRSRFVACSETPEQSEESFRSCINKVE